MSRAAYASFAGSPRRWQLEGTELVTWGGETFNILFAALFTRAAPRRRFVATAEGVLGPVQSLDLSRRESETEKRRSVPWASFRRWLDRVAAIDAVGSMLRPVPDLPDHGVDS